MVIGVFPFLKLGVLFVKQISKPLAQVIVNQAKNHHIFRTYFIIPPAQFYHWAEVKAKMYLMNLGKPTKVAKLNETMAIELGASLMGEVIIFSVAGACIVLEYNRQVAKEAKKEEARLAQLNKFTTDIEALQKSMTAHEAEIRYLHTLIEELAKHTKHKLPARSKLEDNPSDISQAPSDTPLRKNESTTAQDNTKSKESEKISLIHRAISIFEMTIDE